MVPNLILRPALFVQDGDTVIHVAARSGHQAVIDILATRLEMGSIIAAGNADGKTPLMLACSQTQNSDACIGYLLSLGADPAAEDLVSDQLPDAFLYILAFVELNQQHMR